MLSLSEKGALWNTGLRPPLLWRCCHPSLTNLLVYWNHRLVGNISVPGFLNGPFVQEGAWCCKSCTIQPFRSCKNIVLQALISEVPAIFIPLCSSLWKWRTVCMWCLLGKHHGFKLLQVRLLLLIFHCTRHAKSKYKYLTEFGPYNAIWV